MPRLSKGHQTLCREVFDLLDHSGTRLAKVTSTIQGLDLDAQEAKPQVGGDSQDPDVFVVCSEILIPKFHQQLPQVVPSIETRITGDHLPVPVLLARDLVGRLSSLRNSNFFAYIFEEIGLFHSRFALSISH